MFNLKNNLFILNSFQKKRIKTNLFSVFSSEGIQILSQIFFAPLMLFFWGVEYFGIWLFLLSIPNIFLIFNINFLDASIQEITIFKSKNNIKKANEIFQNSIVLVLLNILVYTLLIILFYFFNKIDFSILKNIKEDELTLIFLLLISSVYLNIFQGIFLAGINSEGKVYINFNITSIIELLSKFSIAISGFFFTSLLYPVIIYFLYTVLKFLLSLYFFTINNRYLFFSFKLVSKKILIKIIKLSIGHTATIISNLIKHSGMIIILGIFYDPYIVGYVVTVKTLFYFFSIRIFGKINHISLYEYVNLYTKKKFNIIKRNIITHIKIIMLLLLLFIFLSITIGPFVYGLWLSNMYELSFLFLLLIILDSVFVALRDSTTSFLVALNKNIILGVSELIFILITILLFFLILYFQYSYLWGFLVIACGSLSSLFFSVYILFKFFKNKAIY
tara:strand:- start:2791 stop:4128 length:1338 start_codon:yes stop_codon:yes gene_type:complete